MGDKTLIIRTKMEHDDVFLRKCLLKLYDRQMDDEKIDKSTNHENGMGFNRADAKDLSSAAVMWGRIGAQPIPLRIKQIRERMLKYSKQLSNLLTMDEINQ